jgi:hypothetical protein
MGTWIGRAVETFKTKGYFYAHPDLMVLRGWMDLVKRGWNIQS